LIFKNKKNIEPKSSPIGHQAVALDERLSEGEAATLRAGMERMEREAADRDELLAVLLAETCNATNLRAIAVEEEQATEAEKPSGPFIGLIVMSH
jgi:hypothetical protein